MQAMNRPEVVDFYRSRLRGEADGQGCPGYDVGSKRLLQYFAGRQGTPV